MKQYFFFMPINIGYKKCPLQDYYLLRIAIKSTQERVKKLQTI